MTGGWAATNTLRAAVDTYVADGGPSVEQQENYINGWYAALAVVEAALDAAQSAVDHDPDETEGREHLHALAAALRAVREGT